MINSSQIKTSSMMLLDDPSLSTDRIDYELPPIAMEYALNSITGMYDGVSHVVWAALNNAIAMTKYAKSIGQTDKDVTVELPSSVSPFFTITNYGVGLTYEEMTRIFSTPRAPLRDDKFKTLGDFGFMPLRFTDEYSILSSQDNETIKCTISRKNGIAQTIIEKLDYTSENGITITIPVRTKVSLRDKEYKDYTNAVQRVLSANFSSPLIVNGLFAQGDQNNFRLLTKVPVQLLGVTKNIDIWVKKFSLTSIYTGKSSYSVVESMASNSYENGVFAVNGWTYQIEGILMPIEPDFIIDLPADLVNFEDSGLLIANDDLLQDLKEQIHSNFDVDSMLIESFLYEFKTIEPSAIKSFMKHNKITGTVSDDKKSVYIDKFDKTLSISDFEGSWLSDFVKYPNSVVSACTYDTVDTFNKSVIYDTFNVSAIAPNMKYLSYNLGDFSKTVIDQASESFTSNRFAPLAMFTDYRIPGFALESVLIVEVSSAEEVKEFIKSSTRIAYMYSRKLITMIFVNANIGISDDERNDFIQKIKLKVKTEPNIDYINMQDFRAILSSVTADEGLLLLKTNYLKDWDTINNVLDF